MNKTDAKIQTGGFMQHLICDRAAARLGMRHWLRAQGVDYSMIPIGQSSRVTSTLCNMVFLKGGIPWRIMLASVREYRKRRAVLVKV